MISYFKSIKKKITIVQTKRRNRKAMENFDENRDFNVPMKNLYV